MSSNYAFCKENLDDITREYFGMVAKTCMASDFTEVAPLGISGDDFVLHGDNKNQKSVVCLRNYDDMLEMLITDIDGKFLDYIEIDGLPTEKEIDELYRQFLVFKKYIFRKTKRTFKKAKISDDYQLSIGFEMLKAWNERNGLKRE